MRVQDFVTPKAANDYISLLENVYEAACRWRDKPKLETARALCEALKQLEGGEP